MARVQHKLADMERAAKALRRAGFPNVVIDIKTGEVRSAGPGAVESEADRVERLMKDAFGEE